MNGGSSTRGGRPSRDAAVRLAFALLVVLAGPARAGARLVVETPPSTGSAADTLTASFRLDGLVESDLPGAGDGTNATLVLVVELWRVRDGWWDSLVASQTLTYRIRHDAGRSLFEVENPDRGRVEIADRRGLVAHLGRRHELVLGPAHRFSAGQRFYVAVKAAAQSLTLDDLQRIDAWLSGDVTEGRGGGLLGIPRALAGLVVDVSGLGGWNASGRSEAFVPNPEEPRGNWP